MTVHGRDAAIDAVFVSSVASVHWSWRCRFFLHLPSCRAQDLRNNAQKQQTACLAQRLL